MLLIYGPYHKSYQVKKIHYNIQNILKLRDLYLLIDQNVSYDSIYAIARQTEKNL
jgi:hypothetical protein